MGWGACGGVSGGSGGCFDRDVDIDLEVFAFSCCVAARASLYSIVNAMSSSPHEIDMPARGPLFLLEFDTLCIRCEHLDWHGLWRPLPLVHRREIMFSLVLENHRIKLCRVLDIAFPPRLPCVVCRPRPMTLCLYER